MAIENDKNTFYFNIIFLLYAINKKKRFDCNIIIWLYLIKKIGINITIFWQIFVI